MSHKIENCPDPPAELSEAASRYWREFAPWLHQQGVLQDQDHQVLSMLCDYLVA